MNRHDQVLARTKESWAEHVAHYERFETADGTLIEYLRWGKPKSSMECIKYYMHHGCLMVAGDFYEGTFYFCPTYTLRDVSQTDLYYFMKKIRGGTHGRDGRTWDSQAAEESLDRILKGERAERERDIDEKAHDMACDDRSLPENASDPEFEQCKAKHKAKIEAEKKDEEDCFSDPYECISHQDEWIEYLKEYGDKRLGSDCFEYADIGMDIDWCHLYHHHGLKEAIKQLDAIPAAI